MEESFAESHKEFLKKNKNSLWLNQEFFIRFPFKRNEIINHTKANHSGIKPKHLQLAEKKSAKLLEFRLFEPSNFQWACVSF